MTLQKVFHFEDMGGGYGRKQVGLRVGDQIIWFAHMDDKQQKQHFDQIESLVDEIVEKCGKGASQ